jgi:hypothetical protein
MSLVLCAHVEISVASVQLLSFQSGFAHYLSYLRRFAHGIA